MRRPPTASSHRRAFPARAVFTETVRFCPAGASPPKLISDKGEFVFRLKLNAAAPAQPSFLDWLQGRVQPAPIALQMTLPWFSEQQLGMRRGLIIMHSKDWLPTTAASTGR